MSAYYNESDQYKAEWLRNLIDAGEIAPGGVDERDIRKVRADDLWGYTQCHFFAGIGGWSCALRLAGWPDDRPVWTGSCPCQPFSEAGQRQAADDERHLWPDWFRLIRERRPSIIFGEQVPEAIALGWLDEVANDVQSSHSRAAPTVTPSFPKPAPSGSKMQRGNAASSAICKQIVIMDILTYRADGPIIDVALKVLSVNNQL